MQKCLGEQCPNHCCSNKFKGLSAALKNEDDSRFVQIQLDNEEVKRIADKGRNDLIETKDGDFFLKLNDDYSCTALENGKCLIYDVRPDVCKLYPYYFDPFCGLCIDKNCPGNFDLDVSQDEIYNLLNNRMNLYNKPQHFFFDGYDIDNAVLSNTEFINKFLNEVKEKTASNEFKTVLIPCFNGKVKEDGGISGVILGENFHFTCHTFCYKNTVFIDCYGKKNYEKDLLPVILKYFNTEKFDLCRDNNSTKGNFGKHIIINYTNQMEYNDAVALIESVLIEMRMTPICDMITNYRDSQNFDILQPIAESHISIHKIKGSVTVDIFSCKGFDENKIIKLLNSNPQKVVQIQRGIYYAI